MTINDRYKAAATKIGMLVSYYWSIENEHNVFVVMAMEWLAKRHKDLHVEYLDGDGWHVGLCKIEGGWSPDGWVCGGAD